MGLSAVQCLQGVPAQQLQARCSKPCFLGNIGFNLEEMNSYNTFRIQWFRKGILSLPLPQGCFSSRAPRDSSIPLIPTRSEYPQAAREIT